MKKKKFTSLFASVVLLSALSLVFALQANAAEPTETVAPITTTEPTETVAPTTTTEPTETVAPTTTTEPTETVAPTTTTEPTETEAPSATATTDSAPVVLAANEYYIGTRFHLQNIGWQDKTGTSSDPITMGTTGERRRLEAIIVPEGIVGKAHIQGDGWTEYKESGDQLGTTGLGKRINAIVLYGNIKYRVHIAHSGWTDWYTSGQVLGLAKDDIRIEAIEIIHVS